LKRPDHDLGLPRFGGANHADGHDNRPRHRKVSFQIHGIDAAGHVIVRRKLKRRYVLPSSRSYRRASLALKPAPHPIIGRANCRQLLASADLILDVTLKPSQKAL
jgi:hypothetical protein